LGPSHRIVVEVEPLEHTADQLGLVELLGLVDNKAAPAHHPALTNKKHLDRRFELVVEQPNDIDIFVASKHHLLLFDGFADRGQPIA